MIRNAERVFTTKCTQSSLICILKGVYLINLIENVLSTSKLKCNFKSNVNVYFSRTAYVVVFHMLPIWPLWILRGKNILRELERIIKMNGITFGVSFTKSHSQTTPHCWWFCIRSSAPLENLQTSRNGWNNGKKTHLLHRDFTVANI